MLGIEPGRDKRQLSIAFAAAYGAMTAIAAANPWTSVLPLLLVVAGFCMSISNTAANALLNAAAPVRPRGRTISLYMLAMRGGLSFGSLLTGICVDYVGVRYALLVNGVTALAVQLIFGRRWLRANSQAALHPSMRSPAPRRS